MELGINTFGLGGLLKTPFQQTARTLKENGITAMEPCIHFPGKLMSTDPLIELGMKLTDRLGGVWMPEKAKEKLALLRAEGVRVEGAHLFIGELTADMAERALCFAKENDLHYYALSYMTDNLAWATKQIPLLRRTVMTFREQNVHLLLHNHDIDLKETGRGCVLDFLLESVPELELELDVGWAARAGLDCTAAMEKYRDRLRVLHFKDMLPNKASEKPRFCAVGEGMIPLGAIIEKARKMELFPVGMVIDQDGSEGDMMADVLAGAARIRAAENGETSRRFDFRLGRSLTIEEIKAEHLFLGKWITDKSIPVDKKKSPVPLTVRKLFPVKKELRRAVLYATAVGNYYVTVNNEKITDEMLAPGYTSYAQVLQYQAYDVTDRLGAANELSAVVSGGWAVGYFGFMGAARAYAPRQLFRCDLRLEYADGSVETLGTDRSWQVSTDGAYSAAGIYEGVIYDARRGTANIPWKNADEVGWKYRPALRCTYGVLAHRQEQLRPIEQHPSKRGGTIYDFGQNCSAVICMKIKKAEAGQIIRVRHAEVLVDGEIFTSNLRKAEASIIYICRAGEQSFTPELTTMGFRYVRVQGIEPEELEIVAQVVSSLDVPNGGFSCSNEKLNQLKRNIQWGARSNFVDIPTDCPQRDERMGWTGDIAVFASTACFNFDTARFFDKWLLDVIHDQGSGGGIPLVVPAGNLAIPAFATAGWGDCASLVPWAQYWKDGDRSLIERQYESIKKLLHAEKFWASFLSLGQKRYVWKWPFQFGDWLSPGENAKQWQHKGLWIATAYFYNTAHIAAQLADTLGKEKDAKAFRALMAKIEDAYRYVFTDGAGRLHEEFQSGYICPIHFGMLSESERQTMGERLAKLAEDNDYKIDTGFLGTPYLLFALSDTGHTETAYKVLLNKGCPGWLYAVDRGATTIWERWDALLPDGSVNLSSDQARGKSASSADYDPEDQSAPSMTSFNHYAYGAVGDWLYRRVAGLEALEPGWKRFRVNPLPGGGLTWAEAHTVTPHGTARARWEIKDGSFTLTVEVPEGTICETTLPDGTIHTLEAGKHVLGCAYPEQ